MSVLLALSGGSPFPFFLPVVAALYLVAFIAASFLVAGWKWVRYQAALRGRPACVPEDGEPLEDDDLAAWREITVETVSSKSGEQT